MLCEEIEDISRNFDEWICKEKRRKKKMGEGENFLQTYEKKCLHNRLC